MSRLVMIRSPLRQAVCEVNSLQLYPEATQYRREMVTQEEGQIRRLDHALHDELLRMQDDDQRVRVAYLYCSAPDDDPQTLAIYDELRPSRSVRILFAFDPRRMAILLLGGDKSRQWERWYRVNIPIADALYDEHLEALKKEGLV